ncbi:DUF3768 domain-containing protein [Methylobacterium sp. Leaf89]|uniref:DUF3768 domain-containing protein n=1 Tax=Methylobacterium sp. Leaf89 TaxID=1736245 RepID=UPI0006F6C622|nr:DUF3768 domain-containing protein [Methylobacterium sp. Leaf89]KQO66383.1 hypothetical protein ASF18_12915 [Methylobacterium sp. Leaf89]
MTDLLDVGRVAALNDILRRSLSGGTLVLTAGVVALGRERQQTILDAIAAFDRFEPDNDPYGEHDFGAVEAAGEHILWKIDCFDGDRVLTILLVGEY